MIREFSEEKKQEIFRILDEIDMKDWKPFMEWCGSRAEEFGDWPEKLGIGKYTRYVDRYQQSILDLNERARRQLNTVFENVAEIDRRYAEQMRECQEELKEQIAMLHKMSEFMRTLTDSGTNIDAITKGSVNENCIRTEEEKKDKRQQPEIVVLDIPEVEVRSEGIKEEAEAWGVISGTEVIFICQITDFIDGRSDYMSYDACVNGLESLYNRELISEDSYVCFKDIIDRVSKSSGMYDDIGDLREQAREAYVQIENALSKSVLLKSYINEDFLRELGFDLEALGIEDFAAELEKGMMQYGITDEISIQMFLAACMAETGGADLLEKYNDNGDAGAGLLQVTGEAQYHFLKMILTRNVEGSLEYEEIDAVCSVFENQKGDYVGYQPENHTGISPKEYIAEHYPIESAVWYWGEYASCYTYEDPHDRSQGRDTHSINQYIALFEGMCEGREEDLFLATQYYVNGALLKGTYLEELCRGWCERDGMEYEPIYQGKNVLDGGSIDTAPVMEISLESIRELAREGAVGNLDKIDITGVSFHGEDRAAPIGMEVRLYYYYYIQYLRENF